MRLTPFFMLVFTTVAGCAPMKWDKAGVSDSEHKRDTELCFSHARHEAAKRLPLTAVVPQITVDRHGVATVIPPGRLDGELFRLEQELVWECMRKLGYTSKTNP